MPYIGFWQEVNAVDTYVFFDDVNFINRGWINRNNVLVNAKKHMFSIALSNASQNRLINEIDIVDDFSKFRKTIVMSYKKAPYFEKSMLLIDNILDYPNRNLARFVGNSIEKVSEYLGIDTKFLYSSEIDKDMSLHRQNKILDICERLKATDYYDSTGAMELYDKPTFKLHGMTLSFVKSNITSYRQYNNEFVPGLSIIDVLMFNNIEKIRTMLLNYELI